MSLLVIGKTGQLSRALARETDAQGVQAAFLDRQACDLSWPSERIRSALSLQLDKADAVILSAAYTAVDKAEEEETAATAVNAEAPGIIARLCAEHAVPIVHLSTDYVFAGEACEPYTSDHPVEPLNAYGRSKEAGERDVRAANPRHAILRTSWVYDGTNRNFLTTMLRLAEAHDRLTVVDDQIGRPTYAGDLARACLAAVRKLTGDSTFPGGTYHVSNTGDPVSWAGFARAIFEAAGVDSVEVVGIPTVEYPTPAKRPAWSVMDVGAFEAAFGLDLPEWRNGLARAMAERDGTLSNGPTSKGTT
ncbi:MAG: dTDP-4-dehydrorhamnose reductase [Litorimonas sp.]